MNANELADELEKVIDVRHYASEVLRKEVVKMLRQQQDEIEALKAEIVAIEKNTDYWADKGNWIQNNKPVAWMDSLGNLTKQNLGDFIPLYTHPVKELHLSLQKSQDGELLAVTYTDDEHRIVEVLWERPPVKELDEDFDAICLENKKLTSENEALKFHIKWLEGGAKLNANPVAWMSTYIDDEGDKTTMFCTHKDQYIENQIPLYTHPVELTDEEIAVIGDKCFGTMSYELWVQTNEFARAILRKAQESDKIESLGTVNIGGVHFRNGKEVK